MGEIVGSYNYTIDPGLLNQQRVLQLPRLVEWVLETAGYHATSHGWGYQEMLKKSQGWVLARFSLQMDSYPAAFEEVVIETWVESYNKLFSSRNFSICRKDGFVYGYARTIWSLLDMESRKAVDLTQVDDIANWIIEKECPIPKQGKLHSVDKEHSHHNYEVKYSDLDFNQHMNTCRYVEQMQNCFSPEWYSDRMLHRLDISFVQEVRYGEEIAVLSHTDSHKNVSHLEIVRSDATTACRGAILWK